MLWDWVIGHNASIMNTDDASTNRAIDHSTSPVAATSRKGIDFVALPSLYADMSFLGMTATQFLGAFNDNLFKQLVLLLALKMGDQDRQPIAMFVFSVPFVLFSGYAGYLADRNSKRTIIVLSKVAEIAAMLLGVGAFLMFGLWGFPGLLVVLFLMGTQSAFFGPGKYGIMPEMLRPRDLPSANGVILMTTFVAIIFGAVAAGLLSDMATQTKLPVIETAQHLWIGSLVCVGIAVVGTVTSLFVRRVPAAVPDLAFTPSATTVPPETRGMLRRDRPLFGALLASSVFWLVAGVANQAVNSLGVNQLKVGDAKTSLMLACIALGIASGSVLAGLYSKGRVDFQVMRFGGWGLVASLLALALPGPDHGQLLGFYGSSFALYVMGIFAGMYAIPLQVFMQSRPPDNLKGRMIAVMNQANFTAIMFSSVVYWLFDRIVVHIPWSMTGDYQMRCPIFAMTALVMVPALLFYHPDRALADAGETTDVD